MSGHKLGEYKFYDEDELKVVRLDGYFCEKLTWTCADLLNEAIKMVPISKNDSPRMVEIKQNARSIAHEDLIDRHTAAGTYAATPEEQKHKVYVYEFFGQVTVKNFKKFFSCHFHGCPTCYTKRDAKNPMCHFKSYGELYEETMKRKEMIKKEFAGKELVIKEVWECEVKAQLRKNEQMRIFFDHCLDTGSFLPRETLKGGIFRFFLSFSFVFRSNSAVCVVL